MNLFAVIPERFFSVLASPLKQDYAAILFRIYDQYQLTTFGMEREVVIDLITDYIEQKDNFFEQALDDEIWEESLDTPAGPRDKAAFILRKLESTGWVTSEVYSNYVQYISLPDYAIKILDHESLYMGREAARQHQPREVQELEEVDPQRRQERLRSVRQQLERRMTREKINAWVLEKLAGRKEISARELGIDNIEEFIKLIYATAYGNSRQVGYRVKRDGRPRVTSAGGRFEFKDLLFVRKI